MPVEPADHPPGDGIAVAVIDSGVHADHPHVRGVAGGVAIGPGGELSDDYVDRIGHGTAVTAAIKERAPAARCYAVRVFDSRLATKASVLVAAIDWAIQQQVHIVNLSLGTSNQVHRAALKAAVDRARARGIAIVSAWDEEVQWLPGCLPGVVAVQVDWDCPREEFRPVRRADAVIFRASGFARQIPGVDPRRNLNGVSFAVAAMSGFLAAALSREPDRRSDPVALLGALGARQAAAATAGLAAENLA